MEVARLEEPSMPSIAGAVSLLEPMLLQLTTVQPEAASGAAGGAGDGSAAACGAAATAEAEALPEGEVGRAGRSADVTAGVAKALADRLASGLDAASPSDDAAAAAKQSLREFLRPQPQPQPQQPQPQQPQPQPQPPPPPPQVVSTPLARPPHAPLTSPPRVLRLPPLLTCARRWGLCPRATTSRRRAARRVRSSSPRGR